MFKFDTDDDYSRRRAAMIVNLFVNGASIERCTRLLYRSRQATYRLLAEGLREYFRPFASESLHDFLARELHDECRRQARVANRYATQRVVARALRAQCQSIAKE